MAATAVYLSASRIPYNGEAGDYQAVSNINASTALPGALLGGKYLVACIGSTFGTVTLEILGPDGSTYLGVATAFSANGTVVADLPAGSYRVVLG